MEKRYHPEKVEKKIYKFWEKEKFFNPESFSKKKKFKKGKKFSIVIPPPNITGSLHMGHALNTIIQDILIRWKILKGMKSLWVPGIDHAGIATQNVVEKELKKEGKTRFDLGREKFIERVWKWKERYGNLILDQLKKLGAFCDWKRTRFTMDKEYTEAVMRAFSFYFKKGLIYRKKRVINWCKRCKTSLSDLELEYETEKGKLYFIKYKLKKSKKFITLATTRPETLLGDMAIAVNPKDKRYKNLIGEKVILPIVEREIPIIGERGVDMNFGTGVVKVTPAHDIGDYKIGVKNNLEILQIIEENGKLNENVPPSFQGLPVLKAREKIVEDLKEKGFLEKIEEFYHQVPKCYRCKTIVEFLPSWQWFLKIKKLKELAKEAILKEKVKFYPKRWKKNSLNWLKNVEDWCISRQIWWGHRFPVWQCQNRKKYFLSLKERKRCPLCKKCRPVQTEDVLDTWFSSALWPFAVFGWPKKTKDLKEFYPTDILVTGRDIIFLWVIRMIFSALFFTKKIPFKNVIVHATVLTKEGKRMSKSLGTGVDPLLLIKNYGTDATRFGICWQISPLQDIKFDETKMIAGRKFCNKVWNASRFVMLQIKKRKINLSSTIVPRTLADKKILKELREVIEKTNKNLERFEFGKALQGIYHFFWEKFCDIYIEKAKIQIKNSKEIEKEDKTREILLFVLFNSLLLLHPFLPFITEEIYQILPLKNKKKSILLETWPR